MRRGLLWRQFAPAASLKRKRGLRPANEGLPVLSRSRGDGAHLPPPHHLKKAEGIKTDNKKSACFFANNGTSNGDYSPGFGSCCLRRSKPISSGLLLPNRLSRRGRGGTALVSVAPPFVSGEARRFLYASSYPIGFLGGGAGEPLFGQQRAVPPHIIFILALTPPRFRAGVFLRPSRRGGGASRRRGSAAAVSAPRADRRWPGPRPGKGRRRFRRLGR